MQGRVIKIFTARVSQTWLRYASESTNHEVNEKDIRVTIQNWCIKHLGYVLEITAEKDPYMVELWDDIRLMPVERNTGKLVTYHQ